MPHCSAVDFAFSKSMSATATIFTRGLRARLWMWAKWAIPPQPMTPMPNFRSVTLLAPPSRQWTDDGRQQILLWSVHCRLSTRSKAVKRVDLLLVGGDGAAQDVGDLDRVVDGR